MPEKLGHYIACAAVDILPPIVRERLELGPEYNLSHTGRIVVKAMAKLAEIIPDLKGPAAQSCQRLGLPRNFLWLSQGKQTELMGALRSSDVLNIAAGATAE